MFSKRGWESIGSACTFDFESEFKQNSQVKPLKWSMCVWGEEKCYSKCIYNYHHITKVFALAMSAFELGYLLTLFFL